MKKWLIMGGLLLASLRAFAHPLPPTVILFEPNPQKVLASATMPAHELETAIQQTIDVEALDEDFLRTYFAEHIKVETEDQAWQVSIDKFDYFKEDDTKRGGHHGVIDFLVVDFTLTPPEDVSPTAFSFSYDAIIHEVITHKIKCYQTEQLHDKAATTTYLGRIALDINTSKYSAIDIQLTP